MSFSWRAAGPVFIGLIEMRTPHNYTRNLLSISPANRPQIWTSTLRREILLHPNAGCEPDTLSWEPDLKRWQNKEEGRENQIHVFTSTLSPAAFEFICFLSLRRSFFYTSTIKMRMVSTRRMPFLFAFSFFFFLIGIKYICISGVQHSKMAAVYTTLCSQL